MADDESDHKEKETLNAQSGEGVKDETAQKDKVEEDDELNDLLDSALEDFTKSDVSGAGCSGLVQQHGAEKAGAQTAESASCSNHLGGLDPGEVGADPFSEEISDEMAKQFSEAMKSFMAQDPALMQQFEKLTTSAGRAGDSQTAQGEFTETLTQTLSGLQENAEGLQNEVSEDELSRVFENLGLDGQPDGEFFPMMQGMMKMLLSKDVLYPSLKEISDKYPKWLSEHKESTEKEEFENYTKQHKIIEAICTEFESESDSETEDAKRQRFEKLMDLMQQMQELGQPPKDIVGEMAPGLEFDENGMPKVPGMPAMSEQCAVM
ncbi:peroxisomal biogenesis factor 19-like [Gigantopelta aegis]|uniref:peroxisomal biogenesis factor 19-like n=1 Tax=Gigantopelta aegis TaxID=1735272 RepID=UPI001B88B325|nr:peroxisomal biogenesis factor 19-like [Gigantopelta aegis]